MFDCYDVLQMCVVIRPFWASQNGCHATVMERLFDKVMFDVIAAVEENFILA